MSNQAASSLAQRAQIEPSPARIDERSWIAVPAVDTRLLVWTAEIAGADAGTPCAGGK
jgi:hypothetical protein